MKLKTTSLAALAAFTIAGPASAATLLFSDNFNSSTESIILTMAATLLRTSRVLRRLRIITPPGATTPTNAATAAIG